MMSWPDATPCTVSRRGPLPVAAFVAAIMVLLQPPSATTAQEVGDRVRVFLAREMLVGQVAEMRADGFHLVISDGDSRLIARAEILRLERDVATGTNAIPWGKKSFARAGLAGASVGFLLGLAVGPICRDNVCDFTIPEHIRAGALYAVGFGVGGGLVGGATGAILGSRIPRDEWQLIPERGTTAAWRPLVGLRTNPSRGVAVMVGARLRF